jgi:AcrR family transcriptional regulator
MRVLPGQASRLPPRARTVNREQASADQRERIIIAGAALIAKRGFHGTTIELIIRRAKVGYATFYKNFSDKEELLLAIFDYAGAEVRRGLKAAIKGAGDSWTDQVAASLAALFEMIAENPTYARVCLVESLSAGPGGASRYERALTNFGPLLRPGREFNKSGANLPDTLESTLVGAVFWIAYQRLIVGETDKLRGLLPETVELVLSPYVGEEEAVRVAERYAAPVDASA